MRVYTQEQIETAYVLAAFEAGGDYKEHFKAYNKLLKSYDRPKEKVKI